MTRALPAAVPALIDAEHVNACYLVEMGFVSGTIRLADAPFDITWNGSTWTGIGSMGSVEQVVETGSLEATGLKFQIAGPLSQYVSLALTQVLQGAPCLLYVCFFSASHVVVDAALEWSGRVDTMTVNDAPEKSAIIVSVESRMAGWQRPHVRRHTDEDQQIDYPGDLFYEFVPSLVSKEIIWPAASWFRR